MRYDPVEGLQGDGGRREERHPRSDDPILHLTAEIVCAFVSKNSIDVRDIPVLMTSVYNAAKNVSEGAAPVTEKAELPMPTVPIGETVFDDYIICLENGGRYRSLTRHLRSAYNMTPEAYRAKWNLPKDYPMIAPALSKLRSHLVKNFGPGSKRRKGEN